MLEFSIWRLSVTCAGFLFALSGCGGPEPETAGSATDPATDLTTGLRPFTQGPADQPQGVGQGSTWYQQAMAHQQAGRFVEAIAAAERGRRAEPQDVAIHHLLAQLLGSQRRYREMAELLQEMVTANVAEAETYRQLGVAYMATDRIKDAEAALLQAVELEPESVVAHNNLAAVYARSSNVGAAIKSLEAVVALDADYARAHANLGRAYAEAGAYDKAQVSLQRALELAPDNLGARQQLAAVLNDLGRYEAAAEAAEAILAARPNGAATHYEMARAHQGLGRQAEAIDHLRQATELDPTFSDAFYRLGQLCARQSQVDCAKQALAQFDQWRRAAQEHPRVWRQVRYQKQALEADPANDRARHALGQIYVRQGWLEAATLEMKQAVASNPDFLEAQRLLAMTLIQQKRTAEAASVFQTIVTRWPRDLGARNNLCTAYAAMGELDAALATCQEALAMAPRSAVLHFTLGNVHRQRDEPARALAAYRQALKLDSTDIRLRDAVHRLERSLTAQVE